MNSLIYFDFRKFPEKLRRRSSAYFEPERRESVKSIRCFFIQGCDDDQLSLLMLMFRHSMCGFVLPGAYFLWETACVAPAVFLKSPFPFFYDVVTYLRGGLQVDFVRKTIARFI